MAAVQFVPVGEICKIVGGGTPSRKRPEFFDGEIPWATVKDFKWSVLTETEEFITDAAVAASATNIVPKGTVLLVSRVGLGKVAIAGVDLAINQDIKALTPRADVLPEYLYWFLLSKAEHFVRIGVGATVKGITLDDIKSVAMPLPTLTEQRRIVDILSRAESIVRLRREAQQKAAELAPAIFLDMFGDPATNPKGWPQVSLKNHLEIQSVVKTPDLVLDAALPCIGADSIETGTGRIVSWPTVEQASPISGKYSFKRDDVLYSKIRPALRKAIVAPDSGYCSADMYPLRSKNGKSIPAYVAALLLSKGFTEYAVGVSIRAQMPKVNRQTLFAYEHPLPPIELQKTFACRVQEVGSVQRQQEDALKESEMVFSILLGSAFVKLQNSEA